MLRGNELLYVIGVLANGMPAGESFIVTTQEVANLAGGGGGLTEEVVSSGASYTVIAANVAVNWNSSDAANKTTNIPTSTGSLSTIEINDIAGTAGEYQITAVPATGAIKGVNEVYTNNGSITLKDYSVGWVSV